MSGGGSSGGGGGHPRAHAIQPVPQTQLQLGGYGGMGPTPVASPYTRDAASAQWMMPNFQTYGQPAGAPNWFSNDAWGRDAVTGQALGASQLVVRPQAPALPQVAPVAEAPAPVELGSDRLAQAYRSWLRRQSDVDDGGWPSNMGSARGSYGDFLTSYGPGGGGNLMGGRY